MEKSEQNIGVVSNFKLEKNFVKRDSFRELKMPILPKSLSLEEKKFLLAVERGDLATVKRIFQSVKRGQIHVDLNCVDPLGRGALIMAIDSENLLMVELLVVLGISTCDALLHAIDKEFVEAVELLLEHEELIHKEGEPYSWERVDRTTSTFTPDITPLVLAAHRNNYEILKILLDRGATVPIPHDVRCGCDDCIRGVLEDSLRHSMSRINAYRALSSPSLIALSSTDPILTAFDLSSELKKLAYIETEFRQEYLDLRRQCQQFACDLLSHTRSSTELAVLLNQDPGGSPITDENIHNMNLARLELAIDYKQKKFVAHPNIQQLLASIWYEGLPGFRRKSPMQKVMEIVLIALAFPFYCLLYMVAPSTSAAQLMKKPFMKFLIHASSYLFFLLLLILVSQRFDVLVIEFLGTESMRHNLEIQLRRQRGNGPTALECIVATFVLGYIFEEIREIWKEGINRYLANMWNVIDICRDGAYSLVIALRVIAYFQQSREIELDPASAYLPKEQWNDFDPQLISEGVCAMANIFSALKLVHLFSINPYLGPLQISLGRMVIDIIKFFFIYTLVLFAFACGLNQLLWYFSDLERQKCYTLPGGLADWEKNSDACLKWRRFANLFEASQSLFWASFGLVDLSNFELTGVKSYTRFWSMLIFGSYSVINVVVLLNLLIAMMSNSYALITEHSDTEWKFARSKLWMSYFDESSNTLPPPFNLFPRPKSILRLITRIISCNFSGSSSSNNSSFRRTSTKRGQQARADRDYRYAAVTRSLVWRYVTNMHRLQEMSEVTEDDINEVKGDISTLRFELLEVFKRNGMDVSSASKNTQAAQGRKMRIWERRLLRDFHVVSVAVGGSDGDEQSHQGSKLDLKKNGIENFRRLASVAVAINSDLASDTSVPASTSQSGKPRPLNRSLSLIGKSLSNESFQSSQNLRKAMEEAQRLVVIASTPDASPSQERKASNGVSMASPSPLPVPIDSGARVLEFLRMSEQEKDLEQENSDKFCQNKPWIKEKKEEKKKIEGERKADHSEGALALPNQAAASEQPPQVPIRGKAESVYTLSAPINEPQSQVNSSRLLKKAPPVPSESASGSSQKPSKSSVDENLKLDAMSTIAEKAVKKNVISFKQEPSLPHQDNSAALPIIETKPSTSPSHDSNNGMMYEVIQEGRPPPSSVATVAALVGRKSIERGESLNKESSSSINYPETTVISNSNEKSNSIKSNVHDQIISASPVSPIGTIDVQLSEVIQENVQVLSEITADPPIDPKISSDSLKKEESSCLAKKSVEDVKTIKRQPSNGWL